MGIVVIGVGRVAGVELTLSGPRVRRLGGSVVSIPPRSSGAAWVERKRNCQL